MRASPDIIEDGVLQLQISDGPLARFGVLTCVVDHKLQDRSELNLAKIGFGQLLYDVVSALSKDNRWVCLSHCHQNLKFIRSHI